LLKSHLRLVHVPDKLLLASDQQAMAWNLRRISSDLAKSFIELIAKGTVKNVTDDVNFFERNKNECTEDDIESLVGSRCTEPDSSGL
jgi:hypothetical protein